MGKTYSKFLISLLLIFLAGAIHVFSRLYDLPFHTNTIILSLYSLVIMFWIKKNKQMILHIKMRKYFNYIGYLLISYLFVRTIKYELSFDDSSFKRYLWYSYYIILIAIGVFLLFSILYIGKAKDEKLHPAWNFVYLLLFIFSILFITNDFHQLIFSFPKGINNWSLEDYGYGPVFYLMVLYCSLIVLVTFLISTKKLFDSRNVKNIFLTLAVPLLWGLYTFFYLKKTPFLSLVFIAFKSPEFNCLITILYIESLIYNRLIPVNLDYEKFFYMSSLDIGMLNSEGQIISKNKSSITKDLIVKAARSPILIDENTLLESFKVSNGYSFFLSDISFLNSLKDDLKKSLDLIAEENDFLRESNKIERDRKSVKKQIEIYELIDNALMDKILKLENILDKIEIDDSSFDRELRIGSIINVYIKRFSNMFLLSRTSKWASTFELKLSIDESLRYLNVFSVMSNLLWDADAVISIDKMLLLYRNFQDVLERNIYSCSAVLVSVRLQDKHLLLSMEVENPSNIDCGRNTKGEDLSSYEFVEDGVLYVRTSVLLGSDDYAS
ncbi:MAG: histidine kinase N-terminal 7TM domain-containing protein [Peptoniphilus grossensis]